MDTGAVYSPTAVMLPIAGLSVQCTFVFTAPKTVAVNCCVPALYNAAVDGDSETDTGATSDTSPVPATFGFVPLCAFTVICSPSNGFAGAVYIPAALNAPRIGDICQVTDPPGGVVDAVNCWI